jgi:hypothetical protein
VVGKVSRVGEVDDEVRRITGSRSGVHPVLFLLLGW